MKHWAGAMAVAMLLAGISPAYGIPRAPGKNFDCQVLAKSGIHALVMVQADSAEDAETVAKGAMSVDMGGQRSPTLSVIECLETAKETFKDSTFQKFVEKMVR
ncbi:hypothetical protein [Parahaliea mediterranea]|uniref:hypothetical protein n=1 Tax=Parahaliea mediterranea TaxID=651086 RepID=UPI0013003D25|nr:hypothetical protein [Parahaliea mediterranea]